MHLDILIGLETLEVRNCENEKTNKNLPHEISTHMLNS